MKLGIVGLPNVGKSTLFNSLTKAGAESANYPFCTIDPNVGVVTVPDERLNVLGEMYHTKKIIPAAIEFVDIAGLVKGASKGEGLGNQFLANIREVVAIVHVVRCFENSNIVHVDGSIDPLRDIETINLELIFSDLEILERRIAKTTKVARNDKAAAKELASRGVTVNAIAPGFIETDMTQVLPEKVKEASVAQIPLGKFGKPEQVAAAAAFLASEDAAYITGQVLHVDGGMVM